MPIAAGKITISDGATWGSILPNELYGYKEYIDSTTYKWYDKDTAADIGRYIAANGGSYSVIEDRGEAIRDAINNHGDNKVVLILGKGRETREKRGTVYVETPSDVDYTLECIKEYDSAAVL